MQLLPVLRGKTCHQKWALRATPPLLYPQRKREPAYLYESLSTANSRCLPYGVILLTTRVLDFFRINKGRLISVFVSVNFSRPPPPKPKPDYHFSSIPVYKEVVVKGSPVFSGVGGYKQSYGDGHKYSTSYGDGQLKIYTEEPYVQKGYGTGSHQPVSHYAELSFSAGNYKDTDHHDVNKGTEYIATQEPHYKGTPYGNNKYAPGTHYVAQAPEGHYKGTNYEAPEGHYKGTNYQAPEGHYKGTNYQAPEGHYKGTNYEVPEEHYKGTNYQAPEGHYKGTNYQEPEGHHKGTNHQAPEGHYKGTSYQAPEGHYKGTNYEVPQGHYKGTDHRIPEEHDQAYGRRKKKVFPKNHSFIKQVSGYKITDYLPNKIQQEPYQDDGKGGYVSHVAIPPKVEPGHSYADIEAAHKAKHGPKAYDSKQYADLGADQFKEQQDYSEQSDYLDDSLPAYKYPPTRVYTHRSGLVDPAEPTQYAGYGTTFYGDSYARIVYNPKDWKISIRAYKH
ncbi:hypothetical protein AVEN_90650-1 [Araneus ventricosus]|uniref:Uncharacterized protein n=1 Tax=Araneus ventricosus TaxID=182803 RepID=A0A4Y2HJN0_ARAVE|nr:hypothetical protein AVEN_90650-1 [Araneus ventricosus]